MIQAYLDESGIRGEAIRNSDSVTTIWAEAKAWFRVLVTRIGGDNSRKVPIPVICEIEVR